MVSLPTLLAEGLGWCFCGGGALGEDKSANDDSPVFVLDRVLSFTFQRKGIFQSKDRVCLCQAYSFQKSQEGKLELYNIQIGEPFELKFRCGWRHRLVGVW